MKSFLAIIVIVALGAGGWFAYQRYYTQTPADAATPPAVAEAPTPAPVAVAAVAPPVPMKHIAPKGIYFLLQSVSITSDSGITGIVEGTKVTVISDKAKNWRVTDGENQFDVPPDHLTNDMDVASAIIKRDEEADAARDASVRDQQDNARKIREQGAAWLAKQLDSQRQQPASAQPAQAGATTQTTQPPVTNTSADPGGGVSSPFGKPGP